MNDYIQNLTREIAYWMDRSITGECSRTGVVDFVYMGGHKIYTN